MGTVYLHIGTAKTGTTSLQRFCWINPETLAKKGFAYPQMPFGFKEKGQRYKNAYFLTLWNKRTDERWKKAFSIVEDMFKEHENVILSDEQVWIMQPEEGFWEAVQEELAAIGADLKVLVYLRPQDQMAESHWNQKVKGKPKLAESFQEFLDGGYGGFPLDYGKTVDWVADHVGKDNLTVRVFEHGQFSGGNLIADFLDALGLGKLDEYKLPGHVSNLRLPENVAEIKRLANAADSYQEPDMPNFYWNAIRKAYGLGTMKEIPKHKTGMFSPEERREYLSRFAEGNAHVARVYLNRPDGKLFYEEPSDLPKWELDEKEILPDLMRVIAGADTYLYEEQEKKAKELEERIAKVTREMEETAEQTRKLQNRLDRMLNSLPLRVYRKLFGEVKKN